MKLESSKVNTAPLYSQVQSEIVRKIQNNEWKICQYIPTEPELCKYFNVSRTTLRKAIEQLVNYEILEVKRGKGTIVKNKIKQERGIVLDELIGVYDYLNKRGIDIKSKILSITEINPKKLISDKLNLKQIQKVIEIKRIRIINGAPSYFSVIYVPRYLAFDIMEKKLEERSLHDVFRKEYGHKILRAERTIYAVNADKEIADILHIKNGHALQVYENISYIESGEPIEYSLNYFISEKIKFEISINLHNKSSITNKIY
jgi:DNA-binding GntR family transcriptional regulator